MGSETFQKRERERKRQERAAERRERREARKSDVEDSPVSTEELMEQFRILSIETDLDEEALGAGFNGVFVVEPVSNT